MMRRVRVRSCVVVIVVTVVAATSGAGAQTAGDGELGPDYVRATARDLGAGAFPGSGLPGVAPGTVSPYEWEHAVTGGRCVVFAGPIPPEFRGRDDTVAGHRLVPVRAAPGRHAPGRACRCGPAGWCGAAPARRDARGRVRRRHRHPRDGGPGVLVVPRCSLPGVPLPTEPPTAAEIWQQTPLPRATVHTSPPGTHAWPGIVNLESRFWSQPLADARRDRGPRRLRRRRRCATGRVRVGARRRNDLRVVGTRRARPRPPGRRSAGGATTVWCST